MEYNWSWCGWSHKDDMRLHVTKGGVGPLFLSSPPWNLSQRSNPLYFGGRLVKFPRDLQEVRCLPIAFDFSSAAKNRRNAQHLISEKTKPILDIGSAGINEKFLNLPNLVSISRMVSGPVIGWMIMNEWYVPAFGALIVSGATDWLDGFLARKMGINAVYGSYLDPLADKVLIGCVALSMVKMDLLHPGLVGLVIFRDIGLVGGAVYKRVLMMNWKWDSWSEFFNLDGQYREKVEPLFISKVNTVLQLLLVGAALLQPDFGTEETQQYLTYLSWLVASTTVASTLGYGIQYFRNKPIIR
ncbi:CDP-diacylglycerol--glycerol-3-phosphate 3-phosphatidyltransferase 1 [Carex littledalei]|uniref:CDP-diacylglycerol--glycerol-3-phosphate 3-phosphatidyltransferase 1 n=1 Tax=Carex littledalei TaxID=544730 RepID=A0A833QQJ7_9POAL|nr:CDP-diacylglycerol--glycerol-3-phosphate 3-phosphatidyltransferase 1 [Carex littledalei]